MADILTNEKQAVPSDPPPRTCRKKWSSRWRSPMNASRSFGCTTISIVATGGQDATSLLACLRQDQKEHVVRATKTGDGLLIEQLKAKAKGSGGSGVFDRPRQTKGTFGHFLI